MTSHKNSAVASAPKTDAASVPSEKDKATGSIPIRVVVAIVNYRTASWTIKALQSLAEARDKEDLFHVSVVDNNSQDDSCETIEATIIAAGWNDWVTFTPSPRNGGFAYGCNLAAVAAIKAGYQPDYLFLHNPDAQVDTLAIRELVRFLDAHPEVGIAGSRILNEDGTIRPSAWLYHSVSGELDKTARTGFISRCLERLPQSTTDDEPRRVDWVTGAAMMVRREVIEDIGWMDESYFLYYEETDWCLRALRAGWPCWQVPSSRVTHCVGQSTQATGEVARKRRVPGYMLESRRRFFIQNHGKFYARAADLAWLTGSAIWRLRCLVQRRPVDEPPRVICDFVKAALSKIDPTPQSPDFPRRFCLEPESRTAPPLPDGSCNCNPPDIALLALLWEDFCTYERNLLEPGLWAVLNHRFGNWRMKITLKPIRALLTLVYRTANLLINWAWGIKLDYIVKLGRRVRIWHHGGLILGAREIGDDVHIRQNTTFGVSDRRNPTGKPIIENGVDIGAGAVIVGNIRIGSHSVIGANSLVNRNVPPYSVVMGNPGRIVKQRIVESVRK